MSTENVSLHDGADLIGGFLAIGEAAKILGVSTSTVRRFDSELRPIRIGDRRVYARLVVERFAAERRAR